MDDEPRKLSRKLFHVLSALKRIKNWVYVLSNIVFPLPYPALNLRLPRSHQQQAPRHLNQTWTILSKGKINNKVDHFVFLSFSIFYYFIICIYIYIIY